MKLRRSFSPNMKQVNGGGGYLLEGITPEKRIQSIGAVPGPRFLTEAVDPSLSPGRYTGYETETKF
jgi:hypothetical protein